MDSRGRVSSERRCSMRTLRVLALPAMIALLIPAAAAARTISLNESAHLHLTSHHGFTLNEVGNATGTISAPIYIHLKISSTNRVSAEINIYPHGGSLTGQASAAYRVTGPTASFSGSMTLVRGSGSYAHAHGMGLRFTGTIKRVSDAVTVQLSGRISA